MQTCSANSILHFANIFLLKIGSNNARVRRSAMNQCSSLTMWFSLCFAVSYHGKMPLAGSGAPNSLLCRIFTRSLYHFFAYKMRMAKPWGPRNFNNQRRKWIQMSLRTFLFMSSAFSSLLQVSYIFSFLPLVSLSPIYSNFKCQGQLLGSRIVTTLRKMKISASWSQFVVKYNILAHKPIIYTPLLGMKNIKLLFIRRTVTDRSCQLF